MRKIQQRCDVAPLSREFIFDLKFAAERNQLIFDGGPNEHRTLLSFLLHEVMDDAHREKIYPGKFDLGNMRSVPNGECTYGALLTELGDIGDDPLKPIKDGIKRLTDRSMSDFFAVDKVVALKVIKLFYDIVKKRTNRVFSKLSPPEKEGKSGLEFREAYPNEKTRDLIWLVGDIREYLGAELASERLVKIHLIFSSLQSELECLVEQIEKKLFASHGHSYDQLVSAYVALTKALDALQFDLPEESPCRLDETLYVYLSSLEFRHYAQAFPQLSDIGTPTFRVPSLARELREFAKTIAEAGNLASLKPHEYECSVKLIPQFATRYRLHLHALMQAALSTSLTENAVEKSVPYVQRLLGRVLIFNSGVPLPEEERAPLPLLVAAFCAVQAEFTMRTKHKPYWNGQPAVGGSLLESLKSKPTDEAGYEEHLQIWRMRLHWFRDTINGHSEVGQARRELRLTLFRRFAELAQITNVKTISEKLLGLRYFVREQCQKSSD